MREEDALIPVEKKQRGRIKRGFKRDWAGSCFFPFFLFFISFFFLCGIGNRSFFSLLCFVRDYPHFFLSFYRENSFLTILVQILILYRGFFVFFFCCRFVVLNPPTLSFFFHHFILLLPLTKYLTTYTLLSLLSLSLSSLFFFL